MAAIQVENIYKSFKVYYDKGHSLKEKILFKNRRKYETRAVLKGINFSVEQGEAMGIIGENGCGKSTMLKLITRIIYPDKGRILIRGRVSSLIELGAGFHPDMSGRENIYINAAIFGLSKKEIDSRLEDIINFSELNDHIDKHNGVTIVLVSHDLGTIRTFCDKVLWIRDGIAEKCGVPDSVVDTYLEFMKNKQ